MIPKVLPCKRKRRRVEKCSAVAFESRLSSIRKIRRPTQGNVEIYTRLERLAWLPPSQTER